MVPPKFWHSQTFHPISRSRQPLRRVSMSHLDCIYFGAKSCMFWSRSWVSASLKPCQSQYCTTSKTSVHRPRGKYLWGTFLLDRELSDLVEGGNLPSSWKKEREFSLQTYPWITFYLFSTKETTFCQKTDKFTYFSQIASLKRRQIVSSFQWCVYISHSDWLIWTKGVFVLHR